MNLALTFMPYFHFELKSLRFWYPNTLLFWDRTVLLLFIPNV
jgi:hypothetical protein